MRPELASAAPQLVEFDVLRTEHVWLDGDASERSETSEAHVVESIPTRTGSLADLERQTIEGTLREVEGNRREAAIKLGIGLRTLYDKLKKYGLR